MYFNLCNILKAVLLLVMEYISIYRYIYILYLYLLLLTVKISLPNVTPV